ncbi:MAG: phosphate ABC transporter permease PstA [Candidatus Ancillula sp.]|jgi:phosphate transport system permease protein|nr:phosphate ABC transporter permease PstA [Candidatus Ancillula sp.]
MSKSVILRSLVYLATGLTFFSLIGIVLYVLIGGIPYLSPELFSWNYNSENVSLMPSLVNTFLTVILSLVISVPIGILAAVFLIEYADLGVAAKSKIVRCFVSVIRIAADTLAGIPSIVYGLFGMLIFVTFFHWGYSLLAGGLTMAIMTLPVIQRTTEEALISVPMNYREGAFALGAGKLRTVTHVVLPTAIPGILSGVILAIGRVVGETAALIFTAGTVAQIPTSVFDSSRTLSVHMYNLSVEGLHTHEAMATGVVLLIVVVIINWLSELVANKIRPVK